MDTPTSPPSSSIPVSVSTDSTKGEDPTGLEANNLSEITPLQWKGGVAAWLGWLFDGLDGTIYTLVAPVFVGQLLIRGGIAATKDHVGSTGAIIQAAFLIGWALGGAVFGRIGDRFGRSKTICITILFYAAFTGLSAFAQSWQELLVFRFLAALGIGGEWAAGSSLVSETWPRKWRPWVSAVLQSAYQVGFLAATISVVVFSHFVTVGETKWIFLIGALPALLTFWIRRAIPEPDEWHEAKAQRRNSEPGIAELFRGDILKTTILTIMVCSVALTTVWALIFWGTQHLMYLPDIAKWPKAQKQGYASTVTGIATLLAIGGNFAAAFMARKVGYRAATSVMFTGGLVCMIGAYGTPHNHLQMYYWLPIAHFFVQGVFGLFPMYIPPLFPTLLRTTGAGFSYNFGRVVAALGTVFFGSLNPHLGNFDRTLFYVGLLFIPGIIIAQFMPEPTKIS